MVLICEVAAQRAFTDSVRAVRAICPSIALWARTYDGQASYLRDHQMVFGQVRGHFKGKGLTVCKTVGSAYVGSNPTPATRFPRSGPVVRRCSHRHFALEQAVRQTAPVRCGPCVNRWCKRSVEPLAAWWHVSFWLVEGLLDLLVGDAPRLLRPAAADAGTTMAGTASAVATTIATAPTPSLLVRSSPDSASRAGHGRSRLQTGYEKMIRSIARSWPARCAAARSRDRRTRLS